jgi:hypothetical protein
MDPFCSTVLPKVTGNAGAFLFALMQNEGSFCTAEFILQQCHRAATSSCSYLVDDRKDSRQGAKAQSERGRWNG